MSLSDRTAPVQQGNSRGSPSPYTVILFLLVFLAAPFAFADPVLEFQSRYDAFLREYWRPAVRINGIATTVFDYARMRRDAQSRDSEFRHILDVLRRVDVNSLGDGARTKAFWINAYNFGAIRLVVDSYPVDSIRSFRISLLKYPWSKQALDIGGNMYSLNQIERDILLRKFNDPRIVFAVSCAAVSCPDRVPETFKGERLETQLDELTRVFLANRDKGMDLDRRSGYLTLSWILQKDSHLFPVRKNGVPEFILPYLDESTSNWLRHNAVSIRYFDHDWTLNDIAQAGPNGSPPGSTPD